MTPTHDVLHCGHKVADGPWPQTTPAVGGQINPDNPLRKLAVILPSLDPGGIEQAGVNLIREWHTKGIQVDVVLRRSGGKFSNQLPPGIPVIEAANGLRPFAIGLRSYFVREKPDYVVAAPIDVNVITLLVLWTLGMPSRTVISFHSNFSSQLAHATGPERIKLLIVMWLLRRVGHLADAAIAVSQGVANDLIAACPSLKNRLKVVYNPVISREIAEKIQEPLVGCPVPTGLPWILFVGRLVRAKGLDILLEAFATIQESTAAHLVVVGDGPLRAEIQRHVAALGLGDRVHMVGFEDNPLPWMREASVFALPSRREGLPSVLIEAMACGTQIVATNCPSGPAEILMDGQFGQLVPVEDAPRFGQALLKSLEQAVFVAPETIKRRAEFFSAQAAADAYLRLLSGTART